MQNMIIKAGDLKVGSQVAEASGFLFDVAEIVKVHKNQLQLDFVVTFPAFRNIGQ